MRRPTVLLLSATFAGAAASACREATPPPARHTTDIVLPRRRAPGRRHGRAGRHVRACSSSATRSAPDDRQAFLDVVEPAFSSRQLRAHQPYTLTLGPDGRVRELTYRIDPDRFLQVQPASAAGRRAAADDGAAVHHGDRDLPPRGRRWSRSAVTSIANIRRSSPRSIAPARTSAWPSASPSCSAATSTSIAICSPATSIEVVFEQVLRDGARIGYGDIVAARLTNAGRCSRAFRFQPGGGRPAYYDAAGLSLKRFFLASPLKFEPRVTSGFSYRRLHPVLGIRRPHLGADFGAPTGAPVVAIADATVVSARYSAGGGNTVTLRHAGGYESRYLHLSAFGAGVRAGARVSQGQVIGRVGATGLVTGAHLHYELLRNGAHVNPVAEQKRNPPGAPIARRRIRPPSPRARAELDQRFVSAAPRPPTVGRPTDIASTPPGVRDTHGGTGRRRQRRARPPRRRLHALSPWRDHDAADAHVRDGLGAAGRRADEEGRDRRPPVARADRPPQHRPGRRPHHEAGEAAAGSPMGPMHLQGEDDDGGQPEGRHAGRARAPSRSR